jgi:hypothetical protein
MDSGKVIALDGEKGKRAELLSPGWHFVLGYPFFVDIVKEKDLEIPVGYIGILNAADGKINNDIVAPKWNKDIDPLKMITNYEYFLSNNGTRGIQQFKLPTGMYKINRFQWNVEIVKMKTVGTGEVLVKESIFGKNPKFVTTTDDEILAVPLVESEDYRGIVNKPFPAGIYGIHPYTERVVKVPVGLQTLIYGGGYISRKMDIKIDPENDKLIVDNKTEKVDPKKDGNAFAVKTKDNYTVHIGLRVLGQIEPQQAPRFAGTIKDISLLDDKVIEPYTKSILLNIGKEYTAKDILNKRDEIAQRISVALRERTKKTGFRTKTVEVAEIDIPPVVLIAEKIASASEGLRPALVKKQEAVKEAIKVQNLQAQANMQGVIAEQKVKNLAATEQASRIKTIADANYYKDTKEADARLYRDVKKAEGAKKLISEIGKEAVSSIMIQETINQAADKFKVPNTLFISGNSKEATDIVSAHMISKSIKNGLKSDK